MGEKLYTAFIADIINSRKIKDRQSVQTKLRNLLDKINTRFKKSIKSKFIITIGDEFQGLLRSDVDIIRIINLVQLEMYPIKFRIGLGIGTISTNINSEYALGSDGPAYYNARAAVDYIEKNEKRNLTYETSICLYPESTDKIKLINLSFALYSHLVSKWDDDLYNTIKLMLDGNTQQEASKKLNIHQSSVKRRLEKASYYNYLHILEVLESVLKKGV